LQNDRKRYHLLDFLRGICIILVVGYHALYDISVVFGQRLPFFGTDGMEVFRVSFVGVLVLLSGISCSLSRSNLKRGIKTLLCGLLISAVTLIFMPSERILFGVLHFFGVAMILFAPLKGVVEKIPAFLGAGISLMLFLLTYHIYSYADFEFPRSFLLFILGFDTGFYSADYYPLIPWFFLFLTGGFLGRFFADGRAPRFFEANPIKPLAFIGRHTLFIYLIHQPILYGFFFVWFEVIMKQSAA
jgi:uncharacterized membrane protein